MSGTLLKQVGTLRDTRLYEVKNVNKNRNGMGGNHQRS